MATPRVRATVKAAAPPSSAFDLSCAAASNVGALLATRRQHESKSRNSFADALFTQGLMTVREST